MCNELSGDNQEDIFEKLIDAIQRRNFKTFNDLMQQPVDINARFKDDTLWTLLMYAVYQESIEMVKSLVAAGADVNLIGTDPEDFALNLAAYAADVEIFNYLAPLTSPELRLKAEKTLIKTIKYLKRQANRVVEDFLRAVSKKNKELIHKAITAGTNVDAIGAGEETALHIASHHGYAEIVQILIEAGCKLNCQEERHGNTPLMLAVKKGQMSKNLEKELQDVTSLLIKAGADLNMINNNHQTALILASQANNIWAVKMLLEAEADVNIKDNEGKTALDYALIAKNQEIIQQLREAGASVDQAD